jgi:hypothetical protein
MKRFGAMLMLLLAGCAGGDVGDSVTDNPQALANLKSQATEIANAMSTHNFAKITDMTHEAVIHQHGGREKTLNKMQSFPNALKERGLDKWEIKLGDLTGVYEGGGKLFGSVPYVVEFGGNGRQGSGTAYLLGVSSDQGATWKFIDGGGTFGDRKKLESTFPGFPARLQLPPIKAPSL